jgi:hypothetical protein
VLAVLCDYTCFFFGFFSQVYRVFCEVTIFSFVFGIYQDGETPWVASTGGISRAEALEATLSLLASAARDPVPQV